MQFSFVVLTWNRYRFLELCLSALSSSLTHPEQCEIVVMDNGSTDGTKETLARFQAVLPQLRVITLDRNYGINAYKKLFAEARGKYVVVVDDDVLEFPAGLDTIFWTYMTAFPDFGFLSLNVVQNEFTNGAKPGPERYTEVVRQGLTVEKGPAGGWCACFRRWQYQLLRPVLHFKTLSMTAGEDGFLEANLRRFLRKEAGVIRDAVCFHATGGHYAREYGHLDREIEKYRTANLSEIVAHYEEYRDPQG